MIGREPLSVTSHLDIDFLRKPAPADVDRAHDACTRSGKRLAVGDVLMYSDGEDAAVRASIGDLCHSYAPTRSASGLNGDYAVTTDPARRRPRRRVPVPLGGVVLGAWPRRVN